jgi:hypothetical protein
MNKFFRALLISVVLLSLGGTIAYSQTDVRGSISGAVYEDKNGDGVCVNSGVQGENPVANIDLEFVSSDEATIVNLYTGSDGTYGLVAAGQSVWRVTVKPDRSKWTVTSKNPLYAWVAPDTGLNQTDINFCIQQGGNAVIVLPESGAAAQPLAATWLTIFSLIGMAFVTVGLVLEWRRQS